ncbi:MAG: isomerase [Hydrogenimonas sp.]|nr:MAG: isomerase [Hydrogenimonas sp.]
MKLKIYQIDAFAQNIFEGNPAAVIPLEEWLEDDLMQNIAMENNLSETAFFVKESDTYHIRWFTPVDEVDMCGHATLASAYVIFEILQIEDSKIVFSSKSGDLTVTKIGDKFSMDFPLQEICECKVPQAMLQAFEKEPISCYKSMDYIAVFDDEEFIKRVEPKFSLLKELDCRGVIITSLSKEYDFITRFFAPKYAIDEDPVTGSAFTQLVTYYSKTLHKKEFHAKQVSARGGEVFCTIKGNRVEIAGYGVKYLEGEIRIPN